MSDNDKVTHPVYNSAPDLLEAAKALIETCRRDGWQKPMPAEIDTLAECVAAEEARLAEEARADYTAHPKCYEMDGSRHCYVCRKTWNVTDAEPPCHPKPTPSKAAELNTGRITHATPSKGGDLIGVAEFVRRKIEQAVAAGTLPYESWSVYHNDLEAALARAKEQREAVNELLAALDADRVGHLPEGYRIHDAIKAVKKAKD